MLSVNFSLSLVFLLIIVLAAHHSFSVTFFFPWPSRFFIQLKINYRFLTVLDLRIVHERWGSSSNPSLNGKLHYPPPADIDRPLNQAAADKMRDSRANYNRPL